MSDRCKPHGARTCRRCETSERLDAETLQAWRVIYTHMLAGQHVDPVEGDRILVLITEVERLRALVSEYRDGAQSWLGAIKAERAAHATTKAELERAEKDSLIYADKFESATARAASEFKRANDNAEKLRATRERAEAAEAKVARVEALVNRGGRTLGIREVRDWALAGDGDD